ncbi:MAG: hypothetical protein ACYDCL_23845 [Myxococcales bacterium]
MASREHRSKANQPDRGAGRALVHELRNRLATLKIAVQTLGIGETLSERGRRRVMLAQREVVEVEGLLDALSALFDEEPAV